MSVELGVAEPPSLFVGRKAELARLDAAWQRARRDGVQVVGLAGAAGSGKTALLRAFAARHRDGPVVWAGGDWEEDVLWAEFARRREHLERLGITVVRTAPRELWESPQQQATVVRTALMASADREPAAHVRVLPR